MGRGDPKGEREEEVPPPQAPRAPALPKPASPSTRRARTFCRPLDLVAAFAALAREGYHRHHHRHIIIIIVIITNIM